jgi:hypothetical protein
MSPTVEELAKQIYVDLVGRSLFSSGALVEPDGIKLSAVSIRMAQAFEVALTKLQGSLSSADPRSIDMSFLDSKNVDGAKK